MTVGVTRHHTGSGELKIYKTRSKTSGVVGFLVKVSREQHEAHAGTTHALIILQPMPLEVKTTKLQLL